MAEEAQALGGLLDRFADFQHMGPEELAAYLSVAPQRLAALRSHTVPPERDADFATRVGEAAAAAGASAARLAQVARVARLLR